MNVYVEFSFVHSHQRSFVIVKDIAHLCQVAVQVKRDDMPASIWDMKKFESNLGDMRDLYERWKRSETLVSQFSLANHRRKFALEFSHRE